jgi:hypothetical protein
MYADPALLISSAGRCHRRQAGREKGSTAMIDGLKIEMTSDELFARLSDRIAHHQMGAAEFNERLQQEDRVEAADAVDLEEPASLTPRHMLEARRDEHREQAGFLELLRSHLVRGEVYRLGEEDLRVADLTPQMDCW